MKHLSASFELSREVIVDDRIPIRGRDYVSRLPTTNPDDLEGSVCLMNFNEKRD